jgi:hypothetical protein
MVDIISLAIEREGWGWAAPAAAVRSMGHGRASNFHVNFESFRIRANQEPIVTLTSTMASQGILKQGFLVKKVHLIDPV